MLVRNAQQSGDAMAPASSNRSIIVVVVVVPQFPDHIQVPDQLPDQVQVQVQVLGGIKLFVATSFNKVAQTLSMLVQQIVASGS